MNRSKHCIFYIHPGYVNPILRSLFNPSDPAAQRCFAVLDGDLRGLIFADDNEFPTWGVVYENASGNLYLGGEVHYPCLRKLISRLRRYGKVIVGLWPEDQRWQLLSRAPDYSGFSLAITNRVAGTGNGNHLSIPAGCTLQPMDLSLFEFCLGKSDYISMYGSAHQALDKGYGVCLTNHDGLLCEAFAGPHSNGTVELSTATHAGHRHQGYATLTCSYLIAQMEQRGFRTYGNCPRDNHASIGLARKLGYQTEREYRMVAWLKRAE